MQTPVHNWSLHCHWIKGDTNLLKTFTLKSHLKFFDGKYTWRLNSQVKVSFGVVASTSLVTQSNRFDNWSSIALKVGSCRLQHQSNQVWFQMRKANPLSQKFRNIFRVRNREIRWRSKYILFVCNDFRLKRI